MISQDSLDMNSVFMTGEGSQFWEMSNSDSVNVAACWTIQFKKGKSRIVLKMTVEDSAINSTLNSVSWFLQSDAPRKAVSSPIAGLCISHSRWCKTTHVEVGTLQLLSWLLCSSVSQGVLMCWLELRSYLKACLGKDPFLSSRVIRWASFSQGLLENESNQPWGSS